MIDEKALPKIVSRDEWLAARKRLLGRQEDWEQPPGRSDGPFMSWLRRHDEYDEQHAESCCHSAKAPA